MGRAEGDGGRGKEERETEIKRNRGREGGRERESCVIGLEDGEMEPRDKENGLTLESERDK